MYEGDAVVAHYEAVQIDGIGKVSISRSQLYCVDFSGPALTALAPMVTPQCMLRVTYAYEYSIATVPSLYQQHSAMCQRLAPG